MILSLVELSRNNHPQPVGGVHLTGQRRWCRRLWRRLARAPKAAAGRPEPRQARPEEPRSALPRGHFGRAGARWPPGPALMKTDGKPTTTVAPSYQGAR
eukprot:scaffold69950_cov64-Phaeocystis_antarctica.AAC.3